MKRKFILPFTFALSLAAFARAEAVYDFEKDVKPIVETYCIGCHHEAKASGGLDLMRFETNAMAMESIAIWQRIGKRLEAREMPPRRNTQPSAEEKQIFLDWIASLKPDNADCDQIATEENTSWYRGYVMSRRLTRAEYENTVRDLLGVELELAQMFPADGAGGEGFDNHGDALFLSAIQMEKYLEAADVAVEAALPKEDKRGIGAWLLRLVTFNWKKSPEEIRAIERRNRLIAVPEPMRADKRNAAAKSIEHFASRAWRRPVSDDEVDRLMEMFDRGYERGDSYEESLKLAYKAALVSPHFIFLAEPEPGEPGVYELGDYPLASRLSYFLWSSMPDEELFAVAAKGELRDTETLRAQVHRMLRDPKARALGDNFASQWLGLVALGDTTKPDNERFPEFDEHLANAMKQESVLFFERIVRENRSALELIDANYTFVNARLARIYALSGIEGDDMRLVELADANRGGILGMAGVLAATSHPLRTSPVLRGKWVLEQVLGEHIPPPPPDAGTLPPDDVQPDGKTLRARLEHHRTRQECAGCHARIDPIGFGLENFDPIGRWREENNGQPIDSAGVLPSGQTFQGPQELKKILLERKDDFARNLSRKMLGYALGRSLTQYDDCVIDGAVESMKQDEYRMDRLFEQIVLSYPFRHRYSRK